MRAEFNYTRDDWNNIEILHRNRLMTRPFYVGFRDRLAADTMCREESGNYKLLNGTWEFSGYETPIQVPPEFKDKNFDSSNWGTMPVPGHWQLNGFGYPHYTDAISLFPILEEPAIQVDNPTGAYRHTFRLEKEEQREYILRFDGVESAYHVWLNGSFVGYSQGSRLTAEFDISSYVVDGENLLAVKVYKFCEGSYLENQDMWWFSGIMRDVSVISRPRLHLSDYQISGSLAPNLQDGFLQAGVTVENNEEQQREICLVAELFCGSEMLFCQQREGAVSAGGKLDIHIEGDIPNIRAWSAEQPFLYRLDLTLRDKISGEILEIYPQNIGFRTVELKDGLILINGKPIKLKGVNRHDWNGKSGRCVTKEDMLSDLILMKQNNINAVRTAHYPNQPDFFDLCDRMGFYVMDEADLECNQMTYIRGKMDRLSADTRWEASYLDRVERMIRRDKNHTSILFWSLGNESGFGSNFVTAGRFAKSYDPTRLVHYEEDRDASIADMYSSMYTRHHELEKLGRDSTKPKPHIVCEYAHAMGNGPGGLKEYWEIFEKYERLQGGFVWEWIEHGLERTDENGNTYYTYGGDYGDYPNSGAFCCDGMIQANRRPTPALRQLKKALEPVRCSAFSQEHGRIEIQNRYDFIALDHLKCICTLESLGTVLWKKEIDVSGIMPQCKKEVVLFTPQEIQSAGGIGEWWINLRFYYQESPSWYTGEDALEVAFHQQKLILPVSNDRMQQIAQRSTGSKLAVTQGQDRLYIQGDNFYAEFDCAHGWLDRYDYNCKKLISAGMGLNIWRAPVDNDKNTKEMWKKFHVDNMCNVVKSIEAEWSDSKLVICCSQIYAPFVMEWKIILESKYTIEPNGKVTVEVSGNPVGTLPECLPRIGMRFLLDNCCKKAAWYGRGPSESYIDCKEGNPIGCYQADAEAFYFPYVVPQETGNHEDVGFLVLGDKDATLCLAGQKPFSFSVLHYAQEELSKATHTCDLHKSEDVYLNLDYAQNGLGSASWGAEALEQHRLYPTPFQFCWQLFGADYKNAFEQACHAQRKLSDGSAGSL